MPKKRKRQKPAIIPLPVTNQQMYEDAMIEYRRATKALAREASKLNMEAFHRARMAVTHMQKLVGEGVPKLGVMTRAR